METVAIVVVVAAVLGLVALLLRSRDPDPKPDPRRAPSTARRSPGPAAPAGGVKAPAGRRHVLVGIGGEVEGKSYFIGDRTVTIGRAPTNFVQLLDTEASRKHCQLSPAPNGMRVLNMRSRNGTFVDDAKVEDCVITDGSELRIGKARFRYLARARVGRDDALARKRSRPEAMQATAHFDADDMAGFLRQRLEEADGDVDAAAALLGVSPEVFRQLAASKGVSLPGESGS